MDHLHSSFRSVGIVLLLGDQGVLRVTQTLEAALTPPAVAALLALPPLSATNILPYTADLNGLTTVGACPRHRKHLHEGEVEWDGT